MLSKIRAGHMGSTSDNVFVIAVVSFVATFAGGITFSAPVDAVETAMEACDGEENFTFPTVFVLFHETNNFCYLSRCASLVVIVKSRKFFLQPFQIDASFAIGKITKYIVGGLNIPKLMCALHQILTK